MIRKSTNPEITRNTKLLVDVEKIERELVKKALTQKLYLAQLQVLQNSCFWKKLFGGLLDNSFNEVAPELCTFSLINVLRTNNSFFQPQLPNLKILVLAHLQFSQNKFFFKKLILRVPEKLEARV